VWRGSDGRFHTIALPDPSEAFTSAAAAAVRQVLDKAEYDDVESLLERLELSLVEHWDTRPRDEEAEASFVDMPVPPRLFDRVVASLPEMEAALDEVDPRWRLDVAMAVDDLADMD
jgi:hypothetical protein